MHIPSSCMTNFSWQFLSTLLILQREPYLLFCCSKLEQTAWINVEFLHKKKELAASDHVGILLDMSDEPKKAVIRYKFVRRTYKQTPDQNWTWLKLFTGNPKQNKSLGSSFDKQVITNTKHVCSWPVPNSWSFYQGCIYACVRDSVNTLVYHDAELLL